MDTSSGQPVGAIWQVAFTVPDLMSAIPVFADRLHAGPWMLMEHLPGMIELVELTPAVDAFFGSIKALSEGWDGTDLIRRP